MDEAVEMINGLVEEDASVGCFESVFDGFKSPSLNAWTGALMPVRITEWIPSRAQSM